MHAPRAGERIAGKYEVEGLLGAGGMGIVVAARHLELGSRVAIKVLPEQLANDQESRARFMREARAAALLETEHAVRVLDVGTLETGAPYIVMERLAGSSLDKVIARAGGPLPVEQATDYLLQACEAMAEAHGRGIAHRDLKPANLFLADRPSGVPTLKVLDFGLAKLRQNAEGGADPTFTATGMIAGTPHYVAPEQLRGLRYADARADVWSLGVIAYELYTGVRPFQADGILAILARVAVDEPAPLRSLKPDLPDAIDAVILRCLRKDPSERVQSAAELAAALRPFALGHTRSSSTSAPSPERNSAHSDPTTTDAGPPYPGSDLPSGGDSAGDASTATMPGPPPMSHVFAPAITQEMTLPSPETMPPESTTIRLDRAPATGSSGPPRAVWLFAASAAAAVLLVLGAVLGLGSGKDLPDAGFDAPDPSRRSAIASGQPSVSSLPTVMSTPGPVNRLTEPTAQVASATAAPVVSTASVGRAPGVKAPAPAPSSVLKKWP